jgi:hypothetical protein
MVSLAALTWLRPQEMDAELIGAANGNGSVHPLPYGHLSLLPGVAQLTVYGVTSRNGKNRTFWGMFGIRVISGHREVSPET